MENLKCEECGESTVERGLHYYCDHCGCKYNAVVTLVRVGEPTTLLDIFKETERKKGTDMRLVPGVRPPIFLNPLTQKKWEEYNE
jgi:hypothetical protein